jgi:formate hydrogenlyase subunit 3/multisubunit Na+/H+ antiporter MnhD subunit
MVNKKLQQAGEELGVSEKDVAKIRRERIKRKLLYPIIGAIIVACAAGIGFLVGRANPADGSGGYPYAAPGFVALVARPTRKRRIFVLVTILLALAGAVAATAAAYKAGQHSVHHAAIKYSVFSRRE